MIFGQGNQSHLSQKEMKMTPAIQKTEDIHAQSEKEAQAQSLNLTHIFKKMKPFPEKMDRPLVTVAIDLAAYSWQAAIVSGKKIFTPKFQELGKPQALLNAIHEKMRYFGVSDTRDVVACYEIGRDGLWIAEFLEANGIACVILSPDVLSGNGREVKTDRLDARRLSVRLANFFNGELECDHVHLRPSHAVQAGRAVSRGRAEAVEIRTQFSHLFKSILTRHMELPRRLKVRNVDVDTLRDALGRPLPPEEVEELRLYQEHYLRMDRDVAAADSLMRARALAARKAARDGGETSREDAMIGKLVRLRGVGFRISWVLVHELFYKSFGNTRQVGCATGLAAIPRASGSTDRCAGISRRSNHRLRAALVELAWLWLRHQPDSALTKWFLERTRAGVSARRMKKVAAVALARKLAVALWKFLEHGEVPEGAAVAA